MYDLGITVQHLTLLDELNTLVPRVRVSVRAPEVWQRLLGPGGFVRKGYEG